MSLYPDYSNGEDWNELSLTVIKKTPFTENGRETLINYVEDNTILYNTSDCENEVRFEYEEGGYWNQPKRGLDMKGISERFPSLLFTIYGEKVCGPLNRKTFFREFYKNGKMFHQDGSLVFPSFDEKTDLVPIDEVLKEETEDSVIPQF